ncbi:MAG: rhodanese-related sulfurtransferase [Bacteroidales bacterium]|nr:rhodanese-related sulfurtransferase [Bacteroidales bacterium]
MQLHNKINREVLKNRLMQESFKRTTISFYRYFYLDNPIQFRDELYQKWFSLNCFGRIYVAKEGINAQMSVPESNMELFLASLEEYEILNQIPIKYAVEDDGKSFYKLVIKVRPKLVADGLDDGAFDVTNVGNHLSGSDFHHLLSQPETVVVDMRNLYESEIGHFEGAIIPEADTFREEMDLVVDLLKDKKDKKVLLYCTGGIRCEKASAYLKHHGFEDVNQLLGGVIEYARHIQTKQLEPKFIGKNFVFDARMGERISSQVVGKCHQCGTAFDTHSNCANQSCHLLFLQCPSCAEKYEGCCSDECKDELQERNLMGSKFTLDRKDSKKKYRKSLTLKLKDLDNE